MEKKYTVKEFVEMWRNDGCTIDAIITRRYSPVLEKKIIAETMVNKSEVKTSGGFNYIDQFLLKINFVAAIILLYTNLNIDHEQDDLSFYNDYDLLNQYGIIQSLTETLSYTDNDELAELNDVFEKVIQGYRERTYSIPAIVSKFTAIINENVNAFSDFLIDFANEQTANNATTS